MSKVNWLPWLQVNSLRYSKHLIVCLSNRAMLELDQILRANEINFAILAALPAFFLSFVLLMLVRAWLKKVRSMELLLFIECITISSTQDICDISSSNSKDCSTNILRSNRKACLNEPLPRP